ncbi:hypothetical protein CR513_01961, partial [Mucuna pruriens]
MRLVTLALFSILLFIFFFFNISSAAVAGAYAKSQTITNHPLSNPRPFHDKEASTQNTVPNIKGKNFG